MKKERVLILGGGLIGASIGFHLVRDGHRDVHLFESEGIVGFHSSGRNAGMLRAVTTNPQLTRFLYESALSLQDWLKTWPKNLYGNKGSILVVDDAEFESYQESMKEVAQSREIQRQEACAMAPLIEAMAPKRFIYSSIDSVIDVRELLNTYLQEFLRMGGKLHRHTRVNRIQFKDQGLASLSTTHGCFEGQYVVNAAGSYAGLIPIEGDLSNIEFEARRRTVLITRSNLCAKENQPFVWDLSEGFYFRPEVPGFLVCPCDEEILGPHETLPNSNAELLFREKALRICPPLAKEEVAFAWTGLRTFSPDGDFVLGPDSKNPNYIWAAGLGGHGVTASKKVGEWISEGICHGTKHKLFSPKRFGENSK